MIIIIIITITIIIMIIITVTIITIIVIVMTIIHDTAPAPRCRHVAHSEFATALEQTGTSSV